MDRSSLVTLVDVSYVKDSYGVNREVETTKDVFARVDSITGSEFFTAKQNGINAELRIVLFRYDYNGEKVIRFNGTDYSVYRTYNGLDDNLELYVQQRIG